MVLQLCSTPTVGRDPVGLRAQVATGPAIFQRRTGWLDPEECTDYLKKVGWDFAPDKTKVLLLTHSGLAAEQGDTQLAKAFPSSDYFIRKTDEHIAFFAEKLESAVEAYIERRFGQVFELLGEDAPRLSSQAEKRTWSEAMDKLVELRTRGTVGDVVDHLLEFKHPATTREGVQAEKRTQENGRTLRPADAVCCNDRKKSSSCAIL